MRLSTLCHVSIHSDLTSCSKLENDEEYIYENIEVGGSDCIGLRYDFVS